MTLRPKHLATLALATLAFVAASAFAVTTYYADDTTYYVVPGDTTYYVVPSTTVYYEAPPIIVQAPPLTREERITANIMDELANDRRLSGYIGVETDRDVVTLRGRVATPGQVDRAGRDALRYAESNEVRNELRPRVGG